MDFQEIYNIVLIMYIFLLFNILTIIIYVFEGLFLHSEYIIILNIFSILLRQIGYISESLPFLVIAGLLTPLKIYLIVITNINIIVLIINETLIMMCYCIIILYKDSVLVPKKKLYKDIVTNIISCSICLENYKKEDVILLTECSHLFHHTCLTQWFEKNRSCPMCRKENVVINIDI